MEKLLFEIGTEEIPANHMSSLLAQLKTLAEKKMTELRIPYAEIQVLGTPRRMTFIATEVAEAQADSVVEAKGPSAAIGEFGQFSADDFKPLRAAFGKCGFSGKQRKGKYGARSREGDAFENADFYTGCAGFRKSDE